MSKPKHICHILEARKKELLGDVNYAADRLITDCRDAVIEWSDYVDELESEIKRLEEELKEAQERIDRLESENSQYEHQFQTQ